MSEPYKMPPTPSWIFKSHMKFDDLAVSIYRDEDLKAQFEHVTELEQGFPTDTTHRIYTLDGDVRKFATEETMVQAIMDGPAELWVHVGTTRKADPK